MDTLFKKDLLICPVTAVSFVGKHLVSGIGPNLHIYSPEDFIEKTRFPVLHAVNIHGIRTEPGSYADTYNVVVFGGKTLCLLELCFVKSKIQKLIYAPIELDDRILDVKFLPCDTPYVITVAIVTAHNRVLVYDLTNGQSLQSVACEECCILYCATILGNSWEELVCVSGTVFNQVVIWTPGNTGAVVQHRLSGHSGVIFSIDYNATNNYLCSVSDDRSIRLYKVKYSTTSPNISKDSPDDSDGWGWENASFELAHVLYGHRARVWDAKILEKYIVSVGEDCTCCVWDYEGHIVQKFTGHKGKSIWSLSVDPDEHLIVTGGGDCSVRVWRIASGSASKVMTTSVSLPEKQILPAIQPQDFPRMVAYLNSETVVVLTDKGLILTYNCASKDWHVLYRDDTTKFTNTLSVSKCKQYILLASLQDDGGYVHVLHAQSGDALKQRLYNEKLYSCIWLGSDAGRTDLFMTTGPEGTLDIWHLTSPDSIELLHSLTLPYTKHRWSTTGYMMSYCSMLAVGDRGGSVHAFNTTNQSKEAVKSYFKVHGKAGVTDIQYYDGQVYSTGRDGQYKVYNVRQDGFELMSSNKVMKGLEWTAGILQIDGALVILGFHTDQFLVHNLHNNQLLMTVPCGGGHRAWDFILGEENTCHFVHVKRREFVVSSCELNAVQTIVRPPIHGKEVNMLRHLHTENSPDGETTSVYLTGGEDNNVQLLQLTSFPEGPSTYQVLAILDGHVSSVRALAVSRQSSHRTLLFSAGGRAELKAWYIIKGNSAIEDVTKSDDYSSTGTVTKVMRDCNRRDPIGSHGYHVCAGDSTDSKTDQAKAICDINSESGDKKHVSGLSDKLDSVVISANQELSEVSDEKVANFETAHSQHTCQPRHSDESANSKNFSKHNFTYRHLKTHVLGQTYTRKGGKSWLNPRIHSDPETRYMDLTSFSVQDVYPGCDSGVHFVAAACSDGLVRLLAYTTESREGFQILAQSAFHNHCVLTVKHHIVQSKNSHNLGYTEPKVKDGSPECQNDEDVQCLDLSQSGCKNLLENSVPQTSQYLNDSSQSTNNSSHSHRLSQQSLESSHEQSLSTNPESRSHERSLSANQESNSSNGQRHMANQNSRFTNSNFKCEGTRVLLLSGATDGRIAIWDISEIISAYCQFIGANIAHNHNGDTNVIVDSVDTPDLNCARDICVSNSDVDDKFSDNNTETLVFNSGLSVGSKDAKSGYVPGDSGQVSMVMRMTNEEVVDLGSPSLVIQAHQSGVNSLDVADINPNEILVTSGGDDNKLNIVTVNTAQWRQVACVEHLSAHAAQITGTRLLGSCMIVTVSIDQRMTLWSIQKLHPLQVVPIRTCYVDVSDISALDVVHIGPGLLQLTVCGVGFQTIRLNLSK